eukprot:m.65994 g.65994  ORF g.65994 m.65994 type:complete len:141 (+) comp23630_c0_seq1:211-633(+)
MFMRHVNTCRLVDVLLRSRIQPMPAQVSKFTSSTKNNGQPITCILRYKYVENMMELRIPHREGHLNLALKELEKGRIICGGALTHPTDEALIIFKAKNEHDMATWASEFTSTDPYVKAGLVSDWEARQWMVVVGKLDDPE